MINQEKLNKVILSTGRSIYRRVVNKKALFNSTTDHQYWRLFNDIRKDELAIDIWAVQRKDREEKEMLFSSIEQAYKYLCILMEEEKKKKEEEEGIDNGKPKIFRRMKRTFRRQLGDDIEFVWRKPDYELKDGEEFLDTWAVSEKTPNDRTHTFDCIDDAYSAQFVYTG